MRPESDYSDEMIRQRHQAFYGKDRVPADGQILSLDFGLKEFGELDPGQRFRRYRRFLYETGAVDKGKGAQIDSKIVEQERSHNFELSRTRRFLYRTHYFTDSGIIGSKEFVSRTINW